MKIVDIVDYPYCNWITDKKVRHRKKLWVEKNSVKKFVVQLEIETATGYSPMVRIDSFHGFAHKDEFFPDGRRKRTKIDLKDLKEAYKYASHEIKENFEIYVRRWIQTN